jgi:hypothetical protein
MSQLLKVIMDNSHFVQMRAYLIEIGWFGKIDSDVIDFFSIWQELGHVTPG